MPTMDQIAGISLQFLLFVFTPLAQLRIGGMLWNLIRKLRTNNEDIEQPSTAMLYFPGLALYLFTVFLLKSVHLPWLLVSLLTTVPFIFPISSTVSLIKKLLPDCLSLNFALWFFVILILGVSLVDTTTNLSTIWVNSYGDLAFHTGIITSFALGDNFPPLNQTMAGVPLTYPFFVNLWAASLWWPFPSMTSFGYVLLYQWLSVWIALYFVLNGDKNKFLPWATLFAGGSLARLGTHSGENISKNYPWAVFLTTTWIPQRTALLGMLGTMTAIKAFFAFLNNPKNIKILVFAGATLALSPLVHTHLFLVTSLFCGLVLLFKIRTLSFKPLVYFTLAALPAVISLPWLLGKEGIITFRAGWLAWKTAFSNPIISAIVGGATMWFWNAGPWFLLVAILWWLSREHALFFAWFLLFIAGNYIHIAVWEWDQMKIFMSLYLIFIAIWGSQPNSKKLLRWHFLLLIAMLPALMETALVISQNRKSTIYSTDDISKANEIVKMTPKDAVFLGAPHHNSPVTLTGRKLFMGFPGTLYSHGLNYKPREKIMSSLIQAITCFRHDEFMNTGRKICPDYLLWTNNEVNKWGGLDVKSSLWLDRTESPFLYKIRRTPKAQ